MIDLHTHSTASDGTVSPSQLVLAAHGLGLRAIALTDHDTVSGLREARQTGERLGLEVLSGVEFSSSFEGTEVHLLGYGFDPDSPALVPALRFGVDSRQRRNREMAAALNAAGYPVNLENLQAQNPGANLGRPHLARALVELGAASTLREAFDLYLGEGAPCFVPREYLPMGQAVECVRNAGGVTVLAHPLQYQFPPERLEALVAAAAAAGVRGMEVYYTGYAPDQILELERLAARHRLFPTGGSDFHGANKPNVMLGKGLGGLQVPDSLLETLKLACRQL